MSGSTYPADRKLTSQVDFDGTTLFNDKISSKTPLNKVLSDFSKIMVGLDTLTSLQKLNVSKDTLYEDFDKQSGSEKYAYLFNLLGQSIDALNKSVGEVLTQLQEGDTSIADALYKSKVDSEDSEASYLESKLIFEQTGSASKQEGVGGKTLMIKGVVPVGSIIFITARDLPNFDTTGKGKANTAHFGYALANGQNGTDNLMRGNYVRIPSDILEAGKQTGREHFTVSSNNINSFEMAVSGTIGNGLSTAFTFVTKLRKLILGSATGTNRTVYSPVGTDGEDSIASEQSNIQHTHSTSLKASHVNNSVQPVALNPLAINLIPIQKI